MTILDRPGIPMPGVRGAPFRVMHPMAARKTTGRTSANSSTGPSDDRYVVATSKSSPARRAQAIP